MGKLMKIIYTTPTCTACKNTKLQWDLERTPYKEIMIGRDIEKEEFFLKYPNVRTVPFIVESEDE
jgi:glutaredoxin